MRLEFDIVDVFTDVPFAGNQLAVVSGAEDLSTEQCLAITREFGFSETTFPSSSVRDGADYATRIFTLGGEVPFAGHPTLGTAWVLRNRRLLTEPEARQHCGTGPIAVRFDRDDRDVVELGATPRDDLGPLAPQLVDALLSDVGLTPEDLAGPAWVSGCGLTFLHLPVIEDAVARARPSSRPLSEYVEQLTVLGTIADPVEGLTVVHVRTRHGANGERGESGAGPDTNALDVHARVFVPGLSVDEDAATGSAAVGLGIALVATGRLRDGGTLDIRQGLEMGRPSRLRGRVETSRDDSGSRPVASRCYVAGAVRHIATGRMHAPVS